MTQHTATSTKKTFGGMAAAALATCSLAAAALVPAPTASATCASFSGINLGSGCTSTFGSFAIALGEGAEAEASGFFNAALAFGPDAFARAVGTLNAAIAAGTTGGALFTAAQAGDLGSDFLNIAISLGNDSGANAFSGVNTAIGNLALNLGQGNLVVSEGTFSSAIAVGGGRPFINNQVTAHGTLNNAFSFLGNGNIVDAGEGPLAIALSFFQTDKTVTQAGTGINVNGLAGGSAAAPKNAAVRVNSAGALGSKKTTKPAKAVAGAKHGSTGKAAAPKHSAKAASD
jgi:hypothetical protein